MRRSTALLSPSRGRCTEKILPNVRGCRLCVVEGVVAGYPRGFALACSTGSPQTTGATRGNSATAISSEDLRKLASTADPSAHEAQRLREKADSLSKEANELLNQYYRDRPALPSLLKWEECRLPTDEEVLQQVEEWTLKQLDQCVYDCKVAAAKDAAQCTTFTFRIDKDYDEDDLNAKKVERVREVVIREMPIRLPGVTVDVTVNPSESHVMFVNVKLTWGKAQDQEDCNELKQL